MLRVFRMIMVSAACAFFCTIPVSAAPSDAQVLSRIRASMNRLGGQLKDLDTMAHLVLTPPRASLDATQKRQFTMQARIWVKFPDKTRFQVIQASLPLFQRWIFVQKGTQMYAYDPVGDRQVTTDFKRLTGRDPSRIDTSLGMLALLYDPKNQKIRLVKRAVRNGVPVYHLRITLDKPQSINAFTKIARSELYVDTQRLVPIYSESYTPEGSLATTTTFQEFRKDARGWAPSRITIKDVRGGQLVRKAKEKIDQRTENPGASTKSRTPAFQPTIDMWVDWRNGVLFPRKIVGRGPDGATSEWTFSQTKVNVGLKDSLFRL